MTEEMSDEVTKVREISCILIPGEEVVFSVYEAPSQVAVRQFNDRATSLSVASSRRSLSGMKGLRQ